MKCEKCGYENSEFDIICEKCGAPLNIENNFVLQEKYNNKPRAIDIEHITVDQSEKVFDNTKKKVRVTLCVFLGLLLVIIGLVFYEVYENIKANDIMIKYEEFIKTSQLGVVYIGTDSNIDNQLKEYVDEYEISYIYISTSKLSKVKKNKIKKELDLNKINSTIIIIQNGKVVDYMSDIDDKDSINRFLKQDGIIPKEEGDAQKVISNFDSSISSENSTLIYIANNKNEMNEKHNQEIKKFCEKYSINYTFVEGYYLTDNQKIRLLKKINYNEIHDELIILVDEGEVKEVTEFVYKSDKEYFELFSRYGIIDITSSDSLEKIDLKKFEQIVASKDKQIIMIGSNDCIYCDKLKPVIGKIGIQNNLKIYYIEVNEDIQKYIEQHLVNIGYVEEKLSTPLVIVTENGQLIDYVIGLSDKAYYVDKLKELGVIR